MRDFFLRDQKLTSCGLARGGPGGIACFCQTCGEVWGRVRLGWGEWLPANQPCLEHSTPHLIGGSFLRFLVWWDNPNGNSLKSQLTSFDPVLIRYEAQARARWIEKYGGS